VPAGRRVLVEETHHHWDGDAPHTYVNGSDPIHTVIRLCEIEVTGFLMLPFSESVGDHHTMVLQVTMLSMVGEFQLPSLPPSHHV